MHSLGRRHRRLPIVLGLWLVVAAGCAGVPVRHAGDYAYSPSAGARAARTALAMIGRPYRYRGDSPRGFDCSGLVRYSYLSAGLDLPHSTRALWNVSQWVSIRAARKGDLVFFNEAGRHSHVGIYLGRGSFVHAPRTGERVRRDSLRNPYWKRHFAGIRRL